MNGDLSLAETAYQRGRAYSQLQLLYLATGQLDKLKKLARIFSVQQDWSSQYAVCLLVGDTEGQLGVLERAGQTALVNLKRSTLGHTGETFFENLLATKKFNFNFDNNTYLLDLKLLKKKKLHKKSSTGI